MASWSTKAIETTDGSCVILRRSSQSFLELVLVDSAWTAGHVFLSHTAARKLAAVLADYADDPTET